MYTVLQLDIDVKLGFENASQIVDPDKVATKSLHVHIRRTMENPDHLSPICSL